QIIASESTSGAAMQSPRPLVRHGRHMAVRRAVDDGAGLGTCEIGQKAEVRCQEEEGEHPPRPVPDRVEQDYAGQQGEALEVKQGSQSPGGGAGRPTGGGIVYQSCTPRMVSQRLDPSYRREAFRWPAAFGLRKCRVRTPKIALCAGGQDQMK